MIKRLYCDLCDDWIIPVEGVTSVYARGYHWCAKHANMHCVNGEYIVDFPSEGKLIPKTIMEGETMENEQGEWITGQQQELKDRIRRIAEHNYCKNLTTEYLEKYAGEISNKEKERVFDEK